MTTLRNDLHNTLKLLYLVEHIINITLEVCVNIIHMCWLLILR